MAEAKLVDSGENLVVLIPEDSGVFYPQEGGAMGEQRLSCTNPVQTYVDLFHCGGRGEEAAEALLDQNLKRAWITLQRVATTVHLAPRPRLVGLDRSSYAESVVSLLVEDIVRSVGNAGFVAHKLAGRAWSGAADGVQALNEAQAGEASSARS